MAGYVQGETYPCEPYREWVMSGAPLFDYRIGYRAILDGQDLGLYASRKAAENALAVKHTTAEAIVAEPLLQLSERRVCELCGASVKPRGMGPHVRLAHQRPPLGKAF